jgi:hypothetical protein
VWASKHRGVGSIEERRYHAPAAAVDGIIGDQTAISGATMSVFFTFKLIDLSARLSNANQWEWHNNCKVDDILQAALLGNSKAQLQVQHISEFTIRNAYSVWTEFDINHPVFMEEERELSKAQTDGTADAMVLHKFEASEVPYVLIGLRPQRYELFRTFVTLNFGRANLSCRIGFYFPGFVADERRGGIFPSLAEFNNRRPYVSIDNASVWFSADRPKT